MLLPIGPYNDFQSLLPIIPKLKNKTKMPNCFVKEEAKIKKKDTKLCFTIIRIQLEYIEICETHLSTEMKTIKVFTYINIKTGYQIYYKLIDRNRCNKKGQIL